jgi:transcriptional regulator with XRE-family HTH domain
MPPRKPLDPAASLWDVTALVLRRLRLDRSLSHAAVGDILEINRSNVARIESGETKLQAHHAAKLDEVWRLDGLLSALVHQATTRHDASWGTERVELQAKASELKIWELAWVPGFFQTEPYARASFVAAGVRDVEAAVVKRMRDQQSLNRNPPPLIRCMLDQRVIEQPIGGAMVIVDQLARLLELGELHTIRIVPTDVGAHVGLDGSFWIMKVGGTEVVYTEASGPGRLVKDTSEVRSYGVWFDRISDVALPRKASMDLIRQAMEGFRQ